MEDWWNIIAALLVGIVILILSAVVVVAAFVVTGADNDLERSLTDKKDKDNEQSNH